MFNLIYLSYVDEIWTPTQWGREIFRNHGVNLPIIVIPESTNCDIFKPNNPYKNENGEIEKLFPKETHDLFTFFSVFKWEDRKNWQILIKAFHEEFSQKENVALVLSNPNVG
jgi:predicted secreted protein